MSIAIYEKKECNMIATTGFFDGVHLGHKAVLQQVVDKAIRQKEESAVITFWPHPRVILHQDAGRVRLLNALDEKKMRLHDMGIAQVFVLPFTPELARLSTVEFFKKYLQKEFPVSALIVGYDHRLGSGADHGYPSMKAIGDAMHIQVEHVEAVNIIDACGQPHTISSTKIREAVNSGDITTANLYLGYRYRLQGVVVEGQHFGRIMGFPTANMQLYEPLKQLPGNGVYATRVTVNGQVFCGMTNIGHRPTVQQGDPSRTIETHILDFSDDIYGQDLTLEFIARIRDEQRFASVEALIRQLENDKVLCAGIKG